MKPLTRAHRRFIRWEPYLGVLLATGFFSFVGKGLRVFGVLGWPEAIFLGTGAASVLAIALGTGLAGWRAFRPLPSTAAQRDHGQGEALGASPDVNSFYKITDDRFKDLYDEFAKWEKMAREVEAAILSRLDKVEAQISLDRDYVRGQVISLYRALAAIGHLEKTRSVSDDIQTVAAELSTPTTMNARFETADQWEEWEQKHQDWKTLLNYWVSIAHSYVPDLNELVFGIHPDQLKQKGVAQAEQFPDTEAFIGYKGFCILLRHWQDYREVAEDAIRRAAFEGATAKERPVS